MSTYQATATFTRPSGLSGFVEAFAREAGELVKALLSPNTIIAEVEQARALQLQAQRLDASDPAAAATLRRRAARIGRA